MSAGGAESGSGRKSTSLRLDFASLCQCHWIERRAPLLRWPRQQNRADLLQAITSPLSGSTPSTKAMFTARAASKEGMCRSVSSPALTLFIQSTKMPA